MQQSRLAAMNEERREEESHERRARQRRLARRIVLRLRGKMGPSQQVRDEQGSNDNQRS